MDSHIERLAREMLSLPATARAELAHQLIQSLDESEDEDVEASCQAEALRRSEEFDRGLIEPVPADELFRRVRERLAK